MSSNTTNSSSLRMQCSSATVCCDRSCQCTGMSLLLPCVPVIHDFDLCICTASLKASTKIIGWVTLVINLFLSLRYVISLAQFQEPAFLTSVTDSKEFFLLELVAHVTVTTVSLLLLLGVYFDIPVLMLPSLQVQLLIQTSHALVHTMLFLVSEDSDVRFGLVDIGLCITYTGFVTFFWMVQYNCYRQFVDKRHCTCGEVIKTISKYPESALYHTEGSQDTCLAYSTAITMYEVVNTDFCYVHD